VSQPDTGTTVLGTPMPLPLILSPVGSPGMFHHDGELAVARAGRHAGLTYGVSTLATQSLEAVADAAQGTPLPSSQGSASALVATHLSSRLYRYSLYR
jgi:isopentenyl diphosphate isomerase/L-lactate dehydrogenase-like FMN-dependent dehydrogenase